MTYSDAKPCFAHFAPLRSAIFRKFRRKSRWLFYDPGFFLWQITRNLYKKLLYWNYQKDPLLASLRQAAFNQLKSMIYWLHFGMIFLDNLLVTLSAGVRNRLRQRYSILFYFIIRKIDDWQSSIVDSFWMIFFL